MPYTEITMEDVYYMPEDECEHPGNQWVAIPNAEGAMDGTPGLTRYFTTYRCTACGYEQDERPDNYEEPFEEPDLDWGPVEDRDCDYWSKL